MFSQDSYEWDQATKAELKSIEENDVWPLVDKPLAKREEKKLNIIDSRWFFTRKTGENGKKTICKARLVIRGFKDINMYELEETYAHVTR